MISGLNWIYFTFWLAFCRRRPFSEGRPRLWSAGWLWKVHQQGKLHHEQQWNGALALSRPICTQQGALSGRPGRFWQGGAGLAPCRWSAYRRWLCGSGWRWRSRPPAEPSCPPPPPWPSPWWCPLSCGWTLQARWSCPGRPWTGTPEHMVGQRWEAEPMEPRLELDEWWIEDDSEEVLASTR